MYGQLKNADTTELYKASKETLKRSLPSHRDWGDESIHLRTYDLWRLGISDDSPKFAEKWKTLLALRSRVNEKLEETRREKKIGKSLEAHVEITATAELILRQAQDDGLLEELFIVSKVVIKPTEGEETITVTRAEDHGMKKCVRCWKYWDHVGSHAEHPELCDRCTKVVLDLKF